MLGILRRRLSIVGCGVLAGCGGASTGGGTAVGTQPSRSPAGPGRSSHAQAAGGIGTTTSAPAAAPTQSGAAGPGFLLRPVGDAVGCTPPHMIPDRQAPAKVSARLSVLRLPRTSIDGLPVLNRTDHRGSADTGWLPASTLDNRGLRRRRDSNPGIYVVPSASVLELTGERLGAPCPSLLKAPVAPGACLVAGPPGGPLAVRCWTLPEIDRGRAVTLVGRGKSQTLAGLVPSGTTLVLRADTGPPVTVRSIDGVVYLPTRLRPSGHLRSQVTR